MYLLTYFCIFSDISVDFHKFKIFSYISYIRCLGSTAGVSWLILLAELSAMPGLCHVEQELLNSSRFSVQLF